MTRTYYLSRHGALIRRMQAAGLPYTRKVFWQIPQRSARYYAPQLRAMRATLAKFTKG